VEACFTCSGAPSSCAPIATCTPGDGCCAPGCTPANDADCPHLISGGLLSITDTFPVDSLIYKSRDDGIDTTDMDPVADGAFSHVYNATGYPKAVCYELKTSGTAVWQARRPTASGPTFAYRDNDQIVGPCKVARVRGGQLLKVKCLGATPPYPLNPSGEGAIGVSFTSGTSQHCSLFGGARRDNNDFFLSSGAAAPSSCLAPPAPCPLTIPLGP
jgi:hypothetical protein